VQDDIDTPRKGDAFTFQDVVHTEGESAPRVRDLGSLWLWDVAGLEGDDPIAGKVAAQQPDPARVICLVRKPDKSIGADPKELGAVVIAMRFKKAMFGAKYLSAP